MQDPDPSSFQAAPNNYSVTRAPFPKDEPEGNLSNEDKEVKKDAVRFLYYSALAPLRQFAQNVIHAPNPKPYQRQTDEEKIQYLQHLEMIRQFSKMRSIAVADGSRSTPEYEAYFAEFRQIIKELFPSLAACSQLNALRGGGYLSTIITVMGWCAVTYRTDLILTEYQSKAIEALTMRLGSLNDPIIEALKEYMSERHDCNGHVTYPGCYAAGVVARQFLEAITPTGQTVAVSMIEVLLNHIQGKDRADIQREAIQQFAKDLSLNSNDPSSSGPIEDYILSRMGVEKDDMLKSEWDRIEKIRHQHMREHPFLRLATFPVAPAKKIAFYDLFMGEGTGKDTFTKTMIRDAANGIRKKIKSLIKRTQACKSKTVKANKTAKKSPARQS